VRLILATRIDVSAAWSTATAAHNVAELRRGATPIPPDPSAPIAPPPAAAPDDRGGDPA